MVTLPGELIVQIMTYMTWLDRNRMPFEFQQQYDALHTNWLLKPIDGVVNQVRV